MGPCIQVHNHIICCCKQLWDEDLTTEEGSRPYRHWSKTNRWTNVCCCTRFWNSCNSCNRKVNTSTLNILVLQICFKSPMRKICTILTDKEKVGHSKCNKTHNWNCSTIPADVDDSLCLWQLTFPSPIMSQDQKAKLATYLSTERVWISWTF